MSAEPPHQHPDQSHHDTPDRGQTDDQPTRHPFTQAWETWQAWSMATTMRSALRHARQQGNHDAVRSFEQHPEWTQGPSPLAALRANRELVGDLTGWQWHAIRDAREQGHGWAEIGRALEVDPDQAKRGYLERVQRQRAVRDANPELRSLLPDDPRAAALAEPNDADRAEPGPGREAGCER